MASRNGVCFPRRLPGRALHAPITDSKRSPVAEGYGSSSDFACNLLHPAPDQLTTTVRFAECCVVPPVAFTVTT